MADTNPIANPIGIANVAGSQINPATYDKQVEMITYLSEIADDSWDAVTAAYPSDTVETYTYTLLGATVEIITVTYTDSSKDRISTVVKS